MSKVLYFGAFVLGAAVGVGASWSYLKTKYEKIAQEEIDSVKEVFSRESVKEDVVDESDTLPTKEEIDKLAGMLRQDKPDIRVYMKSLKDAGYVKEDSIYVISPEEFGENEEYDKLSYTYYADEVLADENDDIIENVEKSVGEDFAEHFGEYEDDAVFVRNDDISCDIEILRDHRTYEEVSGKKPRPINL